MSFRSREGSSTALTQHGAREIRIEADFAGQRLDNHLFRLLRDVPKSRIYRMLRNGEVRVNGGRVKPDYRVQAGDRVRLPPVRTEPRAARDEAIAPARQRDLSAAIIHEDPRLLALNKPAGVAVHGGTGVEYGVIEILRAARPDEPMLELAHRLDRETSGCLLLARERKALIALHELLRSHNGIDKRYLALVNGQWDGERRRVSSALQRRGPQGQVRRSASAEDGKLADSEFAPLQRFADATLMEVRIFTGRTHQIRVHAAESGHPILGDDKYGDFAANRKWRKLGLKRMFLHAARMRFTWPWGGDPIEIHAPLPDDLGAVLEHLQTPHESEI
ncbi:MAG: RluA family pseudouridine synthase [Thiotrichales bacterium]